MDIQVWSDIICPWCYIGKNRLEKALSPAYSPSAASSSAAASSSVASSSSASSPSAASSFEATVTYRAYQLDPSPVPLGTPLKTVLAGKFGGPERVDQMWAQVTSIAAEDGLTLNFDKAVAANTFDAHRLIFWAAQQGRQREMLEVLQRAHFTDGEDIGSHGVLARLAGSLGLDNTAALAFLSTTDGQHEVGGDIAIARELGINSVPTFVIDGKYAVQGAQEPAMLRDALTEIARREAA